MVFIWRVKMKKFMFLSVLMLVIFCSCQLFAAEDNSDAQACNYARKANDVKAWETYLKKFPKGACAFQAEVEMEKANSIACANGCKDSVTGYVWSSLAPNELNWNDAVAYCENLNEGGKSDWMLPSINVLKTIVVKGKSKFGDTSLFWSSSSNVPDGAWGIGFMMGTLFGNGRSSKHGVRCVRWDRTVKK
jgi:hypothetical protein